MSAKHTPGPWTRNANGDLIFSPPIYPAADDPSRLCSREICRITGHRTYFGEGNAALIIAAPELLAACEHVCDVIQGGDKFETLEPWAKELLTDVLSAIAKAKGE